MKKETKMLFDVRFKGIEYSRALAESVEEKFSKLEKFEIKPITVHVTFRAERHVKLAEVYIQGLNSPFRARGAGESYLESLDNVLKKLWRQMAREKAKVKHHKSHERSSSGRLEALLRMEKAGRKAA
jgi:ribosomal subunit interface protein